MSTRSRRGAALESELIELDEEFDFDEGEMSENFSDSEEVEASDGSSDDSEDDIAYIPKAKKAIQPSLTKAHIKSAGNNSVVQPKSTSTTTSTSVLLNKATTSTTSATSSATTTANTAATMTSSASTSTSGSGSGSGAIPTTFVSIPTETSMIIPTTIDTTTSTADMAISMGDSTLHETRIDFDDDSNASVEDNSTPTINFDIVNYLNTPFSIHNAVEQGNYRFLRHCLLPNPITLINPYESLIQSKLNSLDYDGCRPIHVAILNGKYKCLEVLIEAGAEVYYTLNGVSPLHMALHMSTFRRYLNFSTKAVELLLQHDAQLDKMDDLSRSPLHLAAQYDVVNSFQAIASKLEQFKSHSMNNVTGSVNVANSADSTDSADSTSTLESLESPLINTTTDLLTLLESIDKDGLNVLHTACRYGSINVVNYLLQKHPKLLFINTKTRHHSPFHTLATYHARRSIKYQQIYNLLSSSVHQQNEQGKDIRYFHHQVDALGKTYTMISDICYPTTTHSASDSASDSDSNTTTTNTQTNTTNCLVSWSRHCFDHITASDFSRGSAEHLPPENVRRIQVLLNSTDGILQSREFIENAVESSNGCGAANITNTDSPTITIETNSPPACIGDVIRCHEYSYLESLERESKKIEQRTPPYDLTTKHVFYTDFHQLPQLDIEEGGEGEGEGEGEDITNVKDTTVSDADDDDDEIESPMTSSTNPTVPIAYLDGDTAVSAFSFTAALHAAGVVTNAIDQVMKGSSKSSFCIIRPPGHHAGPSGVVHTSQERYGSSHGFCLLNNIAIGAAYSMCVYRQQIRKVAIIDFDVHHGNGTEAIVRNLIPTLQEITIPNDFGTLISRKPSYKPWRDSHDRENVFFASVHGLSNNGPWFYPGSGPTTEGVVDAVANRVVFPEQLPASLQDVIGLRKGIDNEFDLLKSNISNISNILDISNHPTTTTTSSFFTHERDNFGRTFNTKDPIVAASTLDLATLPPSNVINVGFDIQSPVNIWRQSWRHAILPKLLAHKPDIIFISAGFDAHRRDDINLGYLGVDETDFYWLTKQLMKVANTVCNGRIVSVLEGGYCIQGKVASPFAQSVAAHVRALQEGSSEKWCEKEAIFERNIEDEVQIELEARRREREEYAIAMRMMRMMEREKEREKEDREERDENESRNGNGNGNGNENIEDHPRKMMKMSE